MSLDAHPVTRLGSADLARTVVAAGHLATIATAQAGRRIVRYVDDGGEPVVVLARGSGVPRGPAALTVQASPRELGTVVLRGALTPVDADSLGPHAAACLAGPDACVPATGADSLHRLVVHHVNLLPGDGRRGGPVALDAYASAEADLFAAFGAEVARHLSEDHWVEIASLALRFRSSGAGAEPVSLAGASVRRLGRSSLEVDLVDVEGAHRVTIPFSRRLNHLAELGGELRRLGAAPERH